MTLYLEILLWAVLWLIGFGIFFYLNKKGITYTSFYFATAGYFLITTLLLILPFKNLLLPVLQGFTLTPLVLLGLAFIVEILVYFLAHKFLKKPVRFIREHPSQYFLKMDYRYLFSKSFEILFQQMLIILFVLILNEYSFRLFQIMILFSIFFSLIHLPLLKMARKSFGLLYVVSSFLSGFIFPPLILTVHYGFVYSYMIHWIFYTSLGVFFWVYKK